jgi:large subunit ribosomal protein L1
MATKSKPTPSQVAAQQVANRTDDEVSVAPVISAEAVTPEKKKTIKKKSRILGKKHVQANKKLKEFKSLVMPHQEAVRMLKQAAYASFDESFELHINVTEVGIKGEVVLPHSNGKTVRVKIADEDLLMKLDKGIVDFDVLVTSPSMMSKLTKYAKLLGPKGLMPNPKAGTIGPNPEELVTKFTGNNLRYKTEPKSPIIHLVVGKKSTPDADLCANVKAILSTLNPQVVKSVHLCTSMSPSLQIVL